MGMKPDPEEIKKAVHKKYAEVSLTAEGKFNYPTGREGALNLGYDISIVDTVPADVLKSFCGVGNPFSLGSIQRGESVLDIGCGSGFDLFIARHVVGPSGLVYGIDSTPEMADKALKNLRLAGIANVQVRVADSETIPYGDGFFNVIISNGVLNLSPLKEKSFQEIYRVLKPGGRLQFVDIVLKEELPPDTARSLDAWCD